MADMYDAERRIVKALPKMAKPHCTDLKEGDSIPSQGTEGHVKKLEQVFQAFDEKPRAKL